MSHLEPEQLALAALGEQLDDDARTHLGECRQCADELDSLAATVSAGRAGGPDELVAPPAGVWQAVSAELGLDPAVQPGGPTRASEAAASTPAGPTRAPDVPSLADHRSAGAGRRTTRQGPATRWLAVAAVAGVVAGGLGVRWWDQRADEPSVIERADLQALPDWPDATGRAEVEETADGTRRLVVTIGGAGLGDGYHEVWLIDTAVSKLVSVGVLQGDSGSFVLPAGLDLAEYPVVDVSEEPFDGNPAHSGDSIVRGVLGT